MGSRRKMPYGKKRKHPIKSTYKAPKSRYQRARQFTQYADYASYAVAIWMWLAPPPYFLVMPIAFALPVIGIVIAYRFSGIVEINSDEESTALTVMYPILIPSIGAALRVFADYNLATYWLTWIIAAILTLLAIAFAIYKIKELNPKTIKGYITILVMIPIFLCYFWSLLIFVNCYLDRSEPQVVPAKVLSKRIYEGDSSDSFYVSIDAWSADRSATEVEVTEDFYDAIFEGNQVDVIIREGTLRFPWYYIGLE